MLRISGLDQGLSYGRTVRREVLSTEDGARLAAEIPLPGLSDARSALAIPLAVRDHLVGVLAAESREPMAFDEWHEAYLEVLGNQIALGVESIARAFPRPRSTTGRRRRPCPLPRARGPARPVPAGRTASASTATTTACSWTGST